MNLPGLKCACCQGPKERKKNWWENFAVYSSVMQTIQTTMLKKKHYLAWEWISCYNIANTSQSFHVGHGHSKDGQLVWFAGERATGGHHVTQFIDVRCHLVSPSSLNLTVAFSMKKKEKNSSIYFFLLKKHNKEGINELVSTSPTFKLCVPIF